MTGIRAQSRSLPSSRLKRLRRAWCAIAWLGLLSYAAGVSAEESLTGTVIEKNGADVTVSYSIGKQHAPAEGDEVTFTVTPNTPKGFDGEGWVIGVFDDHLRIAVTSGFPQPGMLVQIAATGALAPTSPTQTLIPQTSSAGESALSTTNDPIAGFTRFLFAAWSDIELHAPSDWKFTAIDPGIGSGKSRRKPGGSEELRWVLRGYLKHLHRRLELFEEQKHGTLSAHLAEQRLRLSLAANQLDGPPISVTGASTCLSRVAHVGDTDEKQAWAVCARPQAGSRLALRMQYQSQSESDFMALWTTILKSVELSSVAVPWTATVQGIEDGTTGDKAGLRPGDRIRSINSELFIDQWDFEYYLAKLPIGSSLNFDVQRGSDRLLLSTQLESLSHGIEYAK